MDDISLDFNSEQLFKIIDNCWDSILIVERNSKVVYANKSFLMLVGYSKDKVLGTPFELFLNNKFQDPFEKLLTKIESSDVQSFIKVICKTKDNHDISLHIAMHHMEDTELIVLNIKQTHDPLISTIEQTDVQVLQEDIKPPKKEKKESDFFGFLDGANKAFGSIFNNEKKEKVKTNQNKRASRKYEPTTTSIAQLPIAIDEINRDQLREYVRNDLDTYESLAYNEYTKEQLVSAKEWHTWQICIMLKLYKMGDTLFLSRKEAIFPKCIQELSKHALQQVIQNIIVNLKKRANLSAKKEILSKDAKWSAYEASCLLYFLLE